VAINVPVDVDVSGMTALETLDEALDEVSENRRAKVDVDTSAAEAATASLSNALADAGTNVEDLRKSLEFSKERAEAKRLEDALEAVAKLRRAGVDVEVEGQAELRELDRALNAVERRRKATVDVDVDRGIRAAAQGGSAIQEAFSGAFQLVAKNAVLMVAAVSVAMAGMPVIGAVAATGLVLAFGSGIAGIGILAAAQNKEVKSAFKDMAKEVVGDVKEMAIPFEATLKSIAEFAGRTWQTFAPELSNAFADIAPVLTVFANQFFRAFEKLAPAIGPLTDAFNDLLTKMGPKLDGFFTKLSDSFVGLSDAIKADPELFSSLFVGLLNIIPMVINGITGLANIFRFVVDTVRNQLAPAFAELKAAMAPISAAFKDASGGMSIMQAVMLTVKATFTLFVAAIAVTVRAIALLARGVTAFARSVRATWQNTLTVTRAVWAAVRTAVTTAVARVRGAVTAGMAAVSRAVSTANARIRGAFSAAWAAIRGVVARGIALVQSVISSGMSRASSAVSGAWGRIRSAFSRGVSSAVAVVRGLPGRVLGIIRGMAGAMYSSGYSMLSSLASGISAGFSRAISAASSGLSRLRSFFPFSPAKRGPFAGAGYTTHSGEALVRDFASSISKTAAAVAPGIGSALAPVADQFMMPTRATAPSVASTSGTTAPGAGGDLAASLASIFSGLQIIVQPGMDRRATAELWLNGQKYAEALA
jgi:phage-related protein